MSYIRDYYGVPAKRGTRIRWRPGFWGVAPGTEGTIVGSRNQYLRVRFDGHVSIFTLHPTWQVDYLPAERIGGAP